MKKERKDNKIHLFIFLKLAYNNHMLFVNDFLNHFFLNISKIVFLKFKQLYYHLMIAHNNLMDPN